MSFRCNNPSEDVDINFVLVHGLDGNGSTFTNLESNKTFQDCIRSSFPRSKIITYEYPNNSIKLISKKHPLPMTDRADNFLFGLMNELDNDKSIHFIGHSMGGLIIKEALTTSSKYQEDESNDFINIKIIYERTRSVTFYATPHIGSALANTLNYVNLIFCDNQLTNNVIKELQDNNPFLVSLKNDFNQLIGGNDNNHIGILSIIEGQQTSVIGKKIVERESAVCGLDKKYEQQILLDHDHRQICKPLYIKDRRFTHFAHFVAKQMQSDDTMIDDEKKGNDDNNNEKNINILFIDPDKDDSDDLGQASRAYKKTPNLASLSSLIGNLLKNRSKSYKQCKLNDLLKDNLMKQNTKILNTLLKTQEFMQHVDESKIHESIQLSNEYWSLLKESKQIITDKKSQIKKLSTVTIRWKKILEKRVKYENEEGPAPTKLDGKYMQYVQKSLCNYFSVGNKDTEEMAIKWAKLTEKLAEQYTWWQTKYEWFKDWKQRQWETMKQKVKSVWGCVDMIGEALQWIGGAVTVCAAIAAIFVSGGTVLLVAGIAAGAAVTGYGVQKVAKWKQESLEKEERLTSTIENCVKQVMDAFNTMKKDGAMLDKLFSDFGRMLCAPKELAKEIEDEVEENEGEDLNWYMMIDNVDEMKQSLDELHTVCIDLIKQIDQSQNNFYAE